MWSRSIFYETNRNFFRICKGLKKTEDYKIETFLTQKV